MRIAIVVPFFNEEKNLIFFVKEWNNYFIKNKFRNITFFFIDDGSTDKSLVCLKNALLSSRLNYKLLIKKNSGHGSTCEFGYKYIIKKNFDYLLQIDSDNQCDPNYFSKFYDKIKNKNFNFIFGYRKSREDGNYRILMSRLMALTLYLKKRIYIKDLNTPYRIMNVDKLKNILKKINRENKNVELFNCMLSYEIVKKYEINWIDIKFRKRYYGSTKFSMTKMLKLFSNFIINI